MKNRLCRAALLCLSALFLTCCTPQQTRDAAQQARQAYAQFTSFSAECDLSLHEAERMSTYTFTIDADQEDSVIVLLQPEAVAGITVTTGESGGSISYAGTQLALPIEPREGFSPYDCVPVLLHEVATLAPASVGDETCSGVDCVLLMYEYELEEGTAQKRVWLDEESLRLAAAECLYDGELVLRVDFTRCTLS